MHFGHTDKGDRDRTEQWMSKEGSESEKAPIPSNEINKLDTVCIEELEEENGDVTNFIPTRRYVDRVTSSPKPQKPLSKKTQRAWGLMKGMVAASMDHCANNFKLNRNNNIGTPSIELEREKWGIHNHNSKYSGNKDHSSSCWTISSRGSNKT